MSFKTQSSNEIESALLWPLPTVSKRIGLCRSSIYQLIQSGEFPTPLKLGRSSRWLPSEILSWVDDHARARSSRVVE